MKKVLKIIAPGVLMFILIYLMRGGKDILEGLYLIFPIIYIVIGMFNYESKMEWLLSILGTSIAFIIPINIFFNMGSCVECVLIYSLLSLVSHLIKRKIKKNNI